MPEYCLTDAVVEPREQQRTSSMPSCAPGRRLGTAAEILRFLVAGAGNTLVSFAAIVLLQGFVGLPVAYAVIYPLGVLAAVVVNHRFVFRARLSAGSGIAMAWCYALVYVLGVVMSACVADARVESPILATALVLAVTVPANFAESRLIARRADATG